MLHFVCSRGVAFTLKILRGLIIEWTATELTNRLTDDSVVDAACQEENQQVDQGEYPCHNSKSNHVVGHIAHAKEDQNVGHDLTGRKAVNDCHRKRGEEKPYDLTGRGSEHPGVPPVS